MLCILFIWCVFEHVMKTVQLDGLKKIIFIITGSWTCQTTIFWSRQDNFKTKHLCKIRITANKAKCKRQWKCITLKAVNTKPTINCKMPWQTCFHYQWKNLSKSIISVMSAFPLSSSHKTWIKESTEGSVTPSRGEALVKVNGRMWS